MAPSLLYNSKYFLFLFFNNCFSWNFVSSFIFFSMLSPKSLNISLVIERCHKMSVVWISSGQ